MSELADNDFPLWPAEPSISYRYKQRADPPTVEQALPHEPEHLAEALIAAEIAGRAISEKLVQHWPTLNDYRRIAKRFRRAFDSREASRKEKGQKDHPGCV
jgi:hypothetical protein